MTTTAYDIIIIGFGPTGATLANLLGQYGWKIAVVEKNAAIYPHPRAVHGDDETLRVFQALGLLEQLLPELCFFTEMQLMSKIDQKLLALEVGKAEGAYGFGTDFWFHQPTLEQILRDGCKRFATIDLLLGWEATQLVQKDDGVWLQLTKEETRQQIFGKYLIGCDGANSMVCQQEKIGFEDFNFQQKWLVIDTFWEDAPPQNWPPVHQQICDPKQPISFIPGAKKHYRWEFMLKAGNDSKDIMQLTKQFLSFIQVSTAVKLRRKAVYTFQAKLAKRWLKNRILLAGDAAHQMPPFLGQGMCSGIRDAHNLAWKLHLVLAELSAPDLLKSYQTERYPHVKTLIKGAVLLGAIIQTTHPIIATIRNMILRIVGNIPPILKLIQKQILKKEPLKRGILGKQTRSLAGQLFIQTKVKMQSQRRVWLDDLCTNHVVILCRQAISTDLIENLPERFPIRILNVDFENSTGQSIYDYQHLLTNWFTKKQLDFVILRPDRYIFDAGKAASFPNVFQSLINQLS